MKLLTQAIVKKFPAISETSEKKSEDVEIIAKFFNPMGSWTWYATEYDGDDLFFGYVDGNFPELGYFSLKELQSIRLPLGMGIERDKYFPKTKLSEVMK